MELRSWSFKVSGGRQKCFLIVYLIARLVNAVLMGHVLHKSKERSKRNILMLYISIAYLCTCFKETSLNAHDRHFTMTFVNGITVNVTSITVKLS